MKNLLNIMLLVILRTSNIRIGEGEQDSRVF
jgi:hypothetical protein